MVCGDYNPTESGFTEHMVKLKTGLTQMVKVKTRDTGIIDWVLTNRPKIFFDLKQLPKLGTSDHYTVLVDPVPGDRSANLEKVPAVYKCDFGRWACTFDWSSIINLPTAQAKCDALYSTLESATDAFLPVTKVR